VQPQMTKDHAFPSIKIDLVPSLAEDTEPKNERLLPSPESRSSLSEHSEPEVLSDELELPRVFTIEINEEETPRSHVSNLSFMEREPVQGADPDSDSSDSLADSDSEHEEDVGSPRFRIRSPRNPNDRAPPRRSHEDSDAELARLVQDLRAEAVVSSTEAADERERRHFLRFN